MLKAVFDTNIIISGMSHTSTLPRQLLTAWKHNIFILITSPLLIAEVQRVLNRSGIREYFGFKQQDIDGLLAALLSDTLLTPGTLAVDVIHDDSSDNALLACAIEGNADYIVTGDKKHLLPLKEYEGIQIITAREFLGRLREVETSPSPSSS